MPGLDGDLEEWQTQEVNVTRGFAIPQGHPRAQALFVLLFPTVLLFHAHINIHWFSSCEMTCGKLREPIVSISHGSFYIINQKSMIPRIHFHCITTWVARSSG